MAASKTFSKTIAFKKLASVTCLAAFSTVLLSGCELSNSYTKIDREKNMETQDYRDALAPRLPEVADVSETAEGVPPLKPYVAMPGDNVRAMPLVSVSLNQTVPLKDALYQIAEQAEYDVEIDPRIRGSIIFTARNRPLDQVVSRIAEIAGLRFNMDDGFMRIELDTPYHKIYKINYLNITRDNSGSVSNDISVVSGEGSDTGSSFTASNKSNSDFWAEMESNLQQILDSNRDSNRLLSNNTPQITAVSEVAEGQIEPVLITEGDVANGGQPEVQVQAPNVQLQVGVIDEDTDGGDSGEEDPFAARFSINQQAGVISVFAPERLHKQINEYLTEIEKSVSAQVLIEAKVLEVSLRDEFSAGIDWDAPFLSGEFGIGFENLGAGLNRTLLDPNTANNFGISFVGNDISSAIDALARFGTVSALSSPRLTVLNNQSAVMNVAENIVYFEVDTEQSTDVNGNPTISVDTEAKTVPEGVLINVIPSIDLDRKTIAMTLRPTVTSVTNFVDDPNPQLTNPSRVPQVNVQEFDSVIKVNNGQAIVMGGLMQDKVDSGHTGVPILSEIPVFGGLFRTHADDIIKTELVVFIKATIVENGNTVHNTDKDLYRGFSRDRRPLRF